MIRTETSTNTPAGFTLLELIVVIMILTIGMGLLVPQFTSGIFANEKKVFLRRLHAALQEARNTALLTSRPAYLTFNIHTGSGNEYFFIVQDNNDDISAKLPKKIYVPDYIDVVNIITTQQPHVTSGEITFIFLPNGLNSSGIINCKDGDSYFHITIKPFARMEIASGKLLL